MSKPDQERYFNFAAVKKAINDLLIAIGENPDRDGLKETPERVARFWTEFLGGKNQHRMSTTFEISQEIDQMIVVSGMRVWSLCEHHLLPFWADVTTAYMPAGRILGLSKFARIARYAASKLQVQERMVQEIADQIKQHAKTNDVAVIARGEHLCMSMRGVKTPSIMVSSVMSGAFRDNSSMRHELLAISQTYGKPPTSNL